MASITIRQLDDDLKRQLRLRAARNGRSMEDEARTILRSASSGESVEQSRATALTADMAPVARRAAPSLSRSEERRNRILLIIGGGIAAYKSLEIIRRLKDRGAEVRCIMTKAALEFITVLSASALSGERVFVNLFDATAEHDVGHIRLAREAELVVVAPATADLMAKMAAGTADDLATAVLLATDAKVLLAPAMNPHMWAHPATRRNVALLERDGVIVIGPTAGEMAEAGEAGIGRMAEPREIVCAALPFLYGSRAQQSLKGQRVIVTSGPTREPIDPVRYIANRSSGKQGHAIASAAAALGAEVLLVTGPVSLPDPVGAKTVKVETAQQMLAEVNRGLPADVAIFAAAVADWRVDDPNANKIKKQPGATPSLRLIENPDILAAIGHRDKDRPRLVIGFAAETEQIIEHAKAKLTRKGCDWMVANDVSAGSGVMGGDCNTVHLVTAQGVESWPPQSKEAVARALVARVAEAVSGAQP
ncbi:MAG TPA: bifunctional phosphopantothenoylcysteine decarboxylase/phosphopantothenate--cysteine ligase CoaBC [Xanthobacteraceae bacterium]|jgi:phosphopantothenoylcysteine decarboxylase/phosphopantothenate--cysteine ligase